MLGDFPKVTRADIFSEASSRIYSPYVFAIGQLLGEIPYSILCAIIYWVLMVRLVAIFLQLQLLTLSRSGPWALAKVPRGRTAMGSSF